MQLYLVQTVLFLGYHLSPLIIILTISTGKIGLLAQQKTCVWCIGYYRCGLSSATIEYSCPSVSVIGHCPIKVKVTA